MNLKTPKNITKCIEYIEEPEARQVFNNMIRETEISAKYIKTDHYFPEDKELRDIYRITIKRNGKTISFTFGTSIMDTIEHKQPDLYDILAGIDIEYRLADMSFSEFCAELDYNEDSIKDKQAYNRCVKQSEKLQRIFTELESLSMPS